MNLDKLKHMRDCNSLVDATVAPVESGMDLCELMQMWGCHSPLNATIASIESGMNKVEWMHASKMQASLCCACWKWYDSGWMNVCYQSASKQRNASVAPIESGMILIEFLHASIVTMTVQASHQMPLLHPSKVEWTMVEWMYVSKVHAIDHPP